MRSILCNILSVVAVAMMMVACKTQHVIEYRDRYVTSVQHDTLTRNVHDSIYYAVLQKGDTVYETKYVTRVVEREKVVVRNDTAYVDRYVDRMVEKEVTPRWAWWCLVFCIVYAVFVIIRIMHRIR